MEQDISNWRQVARVLVENPDSRVDESRSANLKPASGNSNGVSIFGVQSKTTKTRQGQQFFFLLACFLIYFGHLEPKIVGMSSSFRSMISYSQQLRPCDCSSRCTQFCFPQNQLLPRKGVTKPPHAGSLRKKMAATVPQHMSSNPHCLVNKHPPERGISAAPRRFHRCVWPASRYPRGRTSPPTGPLLKK